VTADAEDVRVERAQVRGVTLAYVRAGVGGRPLLLLHGWPETKRIWWRNIGPLASAGFEVIVPDLRGFGESDVAPDGHYDLATHARDCHALVHDVLGHASCVAAAGDLGGAILFDLGLRFPGFVTRQCVFNCPLPPLRDAFVAAGLDPHVSARVRQAADYYVRQGREADALAAELATPELRRRYIATFYGPRFWASPGTFTPADVDFMTEPFADGAKLRAGFANYEYAMGTRSFVEPPRFLETTPVPTLVLYGPDDHVVYPDVPQRAAVVFTECIGPFVVEGAGHFLQWERADVLNQALRYFLG
jgi:pimeloyl-ACP methyl ester carboxylesterase